MSQQYLSSSTTGVGTPNNQSTPVANKTQLWDLISQITIQVDQLMDQDTETKHALQG